MKQALIVIDMQTHFCESYNDRIVRECINEIRRAKRLNLPIFLVEYVGCGQTDSRLKQEANGHKLLHRVTKYDDDGSYEIEKRFKLKKYAFNSVRVCGVNAPYCVAETVEGLQRRLPNMKVYINNRACGTVGDSRRPKYRSNLEYSGVDKFKNVRRIKV